MSTTMCLMHGCPHPSSDRAARGWPKAPSVVTAAPRAIIDSHSRRPVVFAMLTRFDSSLAPSEPSTFFAPVSPHGHPARISVIDMTIEMSQVDHASDPAQLIEAYYEAGWTDGLPVVPPSDASVAAMLAASKRR